LLAQAAVSGQETGSDEVSDETSQAEVEAQSEVLNRMDCGAITGTDYLSEEERVWFLANCLGATTGYVPPANNFVPPPAGHIYGVEYAINDRLIIPSIGLDAPVNGMDVDADALMKDPTGFFNAVWYNFAAIPGLGGYVESGNLVMAGHVDCARCYNGASGPALFYYLENVVPTDQIIYMSGELEYVYEVTAVADFPSDSDWTGIVASGNSDLTIITCNGTFDTSIREYTHRRVVFASRVSSPEILATAGSDTGSDTPAMP
jgi:sortase (surface protein transpeptidase)